MRHFNTAGPCQADIHYMLDPSARLPAAARLLEQRAYFGLHAPRQSGKTTLLRALAQSVNAEGRFLAAVLSAEVGAPFGDDIAACEAALLADWHEELRAQLPPALVPEPFGDAPAGSRVRVALSAWARASARPLVVFIDEIDTLSGDGLLSILRQLRTGFSARPTSFPSTIALIGLRDVRDYVVASGGKGKVGSASPFNIKADSLTLDDFTRAELEALYAQHTEETGQRFAADALDRAFALSRGQPWLVNALARQCVEALVTGGAPIESHHVDEAGALLVRRMDTHLDSLSERLREPRVRAVIGPLMEGDVLRDVSVDDLRYVQDLGLVRVDAQGSLEIANPIYREIVGRMLAMPTRASLPSLEPRWLREGKLDANALLESFVTFWRQHAEALLGTASYPEIAPHLVLLAYLDRVANGAGRVTREVAIGSGRMDVLLTYGDARVALELKVWRDGRSDPAARGLEQLDTYLAGLSLDEGWLVVFDARAHQPPMERASPSTSARRRAVGAFISFAHSLGRGGRRLRRALALRKELYCTICSQHGGSVIVRKKLP